MEACKVLRQLSSFLFHGIDKRKKKESYRTVTLKARIYRVQGSIRKHSEHPGLIYLPTLPFHTSMHEASSLPSPHPHFITVMPRTEARWGASVPGTEPWVGTLFLLLKLCAMGMVIQTSSLSFFICDMETQDKPMCMCITVREKEENIHKKVANYKFKCEVV